MGEKRVNWSSIQLLILYNQVNGICPMCQKPLWYEKNGQKYKAFEVAHIYPLNPTEQEIKILENEPKLFQRDKNDLSNVIALCPNCHTYVDKPTTIETYKKLYDLKKKFIENDKIEALYSSYTIEEDITNIINAMMSGLNNTTEQIEYKLINVDRKITSNNILLRNKVRTDVSQYYLFIKNLFCEMDKTNLGTFELIAGQIKAFYLKINTISDNQEEIYNHIAEWLYDKYKIGSKEAYKIIVSFFIQDCEVFTDAT